MTHAPDYLPAAGRDAFLPLYDPLMRLLGFQSAMTPLIEQAQLAPGLGILDVGCGTGTLAIRIAREHPRVTITGVDPDPNALARARRKAARARVSVSFEQGFVERLPFEEGAFDRVFSSMMFHHLRKDVRTAALSEIRRVLRPGGRLELVDFAGGAHNSLAQILHGNQLNAAAEDRLLRRMTDAGLAAATRTGARRTLVGTIAYYQAARPS
jgi:ubiquinone/menaquinone biosynthesis C-methylase UbiE